MLTEFAFTPSIFDEDAHDDKESWREQVRTLGHLMCPRVSAWPVVVSDLYAGSWYAVAQQAVNAIKDDKARILCKDLLGKIGSMRVARPACGDWPENNVQWGREAVASNNQEPIERIVTDAVTRAALTDEYRVVRSLDEVEDQGFSSGIAADASPKMSIAEQVQLLRKLCLHADWIALINPYTTTNEMQFALELLKTAFRLPARFPEPTIELHVQEPQNCTNDDDRHERLHRVRNHIRSQVAPMLKEKQRVELYFWPKLLERVFLAGSYASRSDGQKVKSPRWGVSMNHVARVSQTTEVDSTEWKLLRKPSVSEWYRRFVAEDAQGKPAPTVIEPVASVG